MASMTPWSHGGEADNTYRINDRGSRQLYEIDLTSFYNAANRGEAKSVKLSKKAKDVAAYKAAFRAKSKAAAQRLGIAFYPKGCERLPSLRRVLYDRMLVTVKNVNEAAGVSQRLGARSFKVVKGSDVVYVVLTFNDAVQVLDKLAQSKNDPAVIFSKPMLTKNIKKMTTTPPDPRFAFSLGNPNYQWHLWNTGQNTGTAGVDVNIRDVWDDYTGAGVIIAIADDGLEINHPDLVGNTAGMVHYNWPYAKADPTPENGQDDSHGTSVAGVSAASWFNGIGGVGSAPEANLVGLRWLVNYLPDYAADAGVISEVLGWGQTFGTDMGAADIDVHNNSWGPGHPTWLAPMEGIEVAALEAGIRDGRGGLGTIYMFAAGNDRADNGNANYGGYVASRYTIGIGAINDQGRNAAYSNPGCALVVSAPSSDPEFISGEAHQGITTTELQALGDGYRDDFGGTSSATPLTSGVVALMLEANPNLGWRDVQEILIASARKNDEADPDWQENLAGFHFNHRYGAGMVDAFAAVNMARTWTNLEPESHVSISKNGLDLPIPDDGSAEVEFDFFEEANKRIEHVLVKLDISHTRRQDLECVLISPSGVESRLTESFVGGAEDGIDYTFLTNFNWGEDSVGVWRVRVYDRVAGTTGTINSIEVTIYGVDRDPELSPIVLGSNRLGFVVDSTADYEIQARYLESTTLTRGTLPPGLVLDSVNNKITGVPTEKGTWFVEFTLTNEYGTTLYPVRIMVGDAPSDNIAGAIEQPDGSVSTNGFYGQFGLELGDTSDGSDAITSVIDVPLGSSGLPVSTYGESHVSLPHSGGGIVVFDWKVDSRQAVDRMWFSPSAGASAMIGWHGFISGERDWGTFASPLPDGSTTLKWSYLENRRADLSGGGGRGLLDLVKVYTKQEYSDMLTEYSGSDLTFSTSGRALWTPTKAFLPVDVQVDAAKVLQASSIGNAQNSELVTRLEGPGRVSFLWKVSSEPKDKLQFIVAGTLREEISGEDGDWAMYSAEIPAGTYDVSWRYLKDSRDSKGMDTGFITSVSFIKYSTYEMWAENHFTEGQLLDPAISGQAADPNHNGISNLLEYAFGGNPLGETPKATMPGIVIDEDGRGFTYRKNTTLSDLTYVMQTSTNMVDWDDVTGDLVATDGVYETYRYDWSPSPAEPKRFFRVKVSK